MGSFEKTSSSFFSLLLLPPLPLLPLPSLYPLPSLDFWCPLFNSLHICDNLESLVLCCVANLRLCPVCACQPHLHCICVMSSVCHVVVPSVSEESPSASESGVLLSQDPSAKPVLLLPPKKPAAFSGDHEETPVKQLSLLKQPPALPPKPTARIANHLTGESRSLWGRAALPSLQGIHSSLYLFDLKTDIPLWLFCGTCGCFRVCLGTRSHGLGLCVVSRSIRYRLTSHVPRAFSRMYL